NPARLASLHFGWITQLPAAASRLLLQHAELDDARAARQTDVEALAAGDGDAEGVADAARIRLFRGLDRAGMLAFDKRRQLANGSRALADRGGFSSRRDR